MNNDVKNLLKKIQKENLKNGNLLKYAGFYLVEKLAIAKPLDDVDTLLEALFVANMSNSHGGMQNGGIGGNGNGYH